MMYCIDFSICICYTAVDSNSIGNIFKLIVIATVAVLYIVYCKYKLYIEVSIEVIFDRCDRPARRVNCKECECSAIYMFLIVDNDVGWYMFILFYVFISVFCFMLLNRCRL